MLVSEYTKPLTGEMLLDIINSQSCLWGDKQLVVSPSSDTLVELFVEDSVLLRCMNDSDMREDRWTLNTLRARMEGLPLKSVIWTDSDIEANFQVGFSTDEGFVEVINFNEILKL